MTSRQAPAATRALRVLRFLASRPEPSTVDAIAREVGIPRSSAYHLLNAMIDEGFVAHLPDEHRYGLGIAAFEVGSGFTRQAPLQRMARRPLAELVDAVGESAHVVVLHGRDVLYVLQERAAGRPPLVSDVGVRLPAAVTASGRAMLASLSPAQLRALFGDRDAFVSRQTGGPTSLSELRSLLVDVRRRGHAIEDGEVTPGLASIAFALTDHAGYPVAAVAVTFAADCTIDRSEILRRTAQTVVVLTRRLRGLPPSAVLAQSERTSPPKGDVAHKPR
jgi:DNA-binding IclR family transcriptional regulator